MPDLHAPDHTADEDNKVITTGYDPSWTNQVLGNKLRDGSQPNRFGKPVASSHPHDACFDAEGNIFVAEWVPTGRVSFLKKGELTNVATSS